MDKEQYEFDLENLRKLHTDLEKQMLKFDEVIPYERQRTAQIYSPRLLNIMLACGPQIEAVTRLISRKCDFVDDGGIPALIRRIDQKTVLANFKIVSIPHQLLFTPFTKELSWWGAYNDLKHELKEKQFKITYTTIMDALAALSALHYLAGKITALPNKTERLLDMKNWSSDETLIRTFEDPRAVPPFRIWQSLLFKIRTVYLPDDL